MVAWGKATSALNLYKKLNYKFSDIKYSEWYDGNEYVELFKPESEIYSMAIANNTIYYNLKTDLSKIYNFNIKTKIIKIG